VARSEMLAGEAANSVAVATTSGRHGSQSWKSPTGWSARKLITDCLRELSGDQDFGRFAAKIGTG
jgi:hypothetical protein